MKTISKLAAVTAIAAATVAVVRKYDLVNKGTALADQGVEKLTAGVEWAADKATEFGTKFLDQFVDDSTEDEAAKDFDSDAAERAAYGADPTADDEALAAFGRRATDSRVGFGDIHNGEGAGLR